VHAIFRHDYPLAVEPASTPRPLVQKKTLRDSLPIYMLLSVLSFLVVAQSSSEVPEGLMNNPVYTGHNLPPKEVPWYSFLLEVEGTPGLLNVYRRNKSLQNFQGPYWESNSEPSVS